MSIRFDSRQLALDFDRNRKVHRISLNKACKRAKVHPSTVTGVLGGTIKDITANTAARMLDYMGVTNIEKYIVETDN